MIFKKIKLHCCTSFYPVTIQIDVASRLFSKHVRGYPCAIDEDLTLSSRRFKPFLFELLATAFGAVSRFN